MKRFVEKERMLEGLDALLDVSLFRDEFHTFVDVEIERARQHQTATKERRDVGANFPTPASLWPRAACSTPTLGRTRNDRNFN